MSIKLTKRADWCPKEYYCAITEDLDLIKDVPEILRHYILIFEEKESERVWAIRKPGRTIGGIWTDKNGTITDIKIGDDCIGGYPSSYTNYFRKYIGQRLELK